MSATIGNMALGDSVFDANATLPFQPGSGPPGKKVTLPKLATQAMAALAGNVSLNTGTFQEWVWGDKASDAVRVFVDNVNHTSGIGIFVGGVEVLRIYNNPGSQEVSVSTFGGTGPLNVVQLKILSLFGAVPPVADGTYSLVQTQSGVVIVAT